MNDKTGFTTQQHTEMADQLIDLAQMLAWIQVRMLDAYNPTSRRPARIFRALKSIDENLTTIRATLDQQHKIDNRIEYRVQTYAGTLDADERARRESSEPEPVGLHRRDIHG